MIDWGQVMVFGNERFSISQKDTLMLSPWEQEIDARGGNRGDVMTLIRQTFED